MGEIVDRSRPYDLVAAAILCDEIVVGTVEIDAVVAGLVRVFEDVRLAVGDMLPKGQEGIAGSEERLACGII